MNGLDVLKYSHYIINILYNKTLNLIKFLHEAIFSIDQKT